MSKLYRTFLPSVRSALSRSGKGEPSSSASHFRLREDSVRDISEKPINSYDDMTRLRHFDDLNTVRFVTFSCFQRRPLLTDSSVVNTLLETVAEIRLKHQLKLFAYVIMPEHVHLVIHPPEYLRLGPVIGELKSKSAGRIISSGVPSLPDGCRVMKNGVFRRVFWQSRCYDHNCRTDEIVLEKIHYCHKNPVNRGLVSSPEKWQWSSFNWFRGQNEVPLQMDEFRP